ncbi:MAG: hypothetical protein ACFB2W_16640 [Leptolyngbyaceae cyanobacterium]
MSERNNNRGDAPIWPDNSDRTIRVNTLLASLPDEQTGAQTTVSSPHIVSKSSRKLKQVFAQVFTQVAKISLTIAKKLEQ